MRVGWLEKHWWSSYPAIATVAAALACLCPLNPLPHAWGATGLAILAAGVLDIRLFRHERRGRHRNLCSFGCVALVLGLSPFVALGLLGAERWDEQLTNHGWVELGGGVLLVSLGLSVLWLGVQTGAAEALARHPLRAAACPLCGVQRQGPRCGACEAFQHNNTWLTLAALILYHRAAIYAAIASLITGGLVTFAWQTAVDVRKDREAATLAKQKEAEARAITKQKELAAESQHRHDLANKATSALVSFRSALWRFATDCIPRSLSESESRPLSALTRRDALLAPGQRLEKCGSVYAQLTDGYVSWTWLVPEFILSNRSSPVCAELDDGRKDPLVRRACGLLRCSQPMEATSYAYMDFADHYGRFLRRGTSAAFQPIILDTYRLFHLVRMLGCATLLAAYHDPAQVEAYPEATGYCTRDFAFLEEMEAERPDLWEVQLIHWQGGEPGPGPWCSVVSEREYALSPPGPSYDSPNAVRSFTLDWLELFRYETP